VRSLNVLVLCNDENEKNAEKRFLIDFESICKIVESFVFISRCPLASVCKRMGVLVRTKGTLRLILTKGRRTSKPCFDTDNTVDVLKNCQYEISTESRSEMASFAV
jgi:hypothetical protein